MSLVAFKKKSVINYGSKRSGKPPGGVWLPQGPFGNATISLDLAIKNPNNSGFSLNGGTRSISVGRDMKMSKSGTPYRGTQPIGYGGTYGAYPSGTLIGNWSGVIPNSNSKRSPVQPVLNASFGKIGTLGTQYIYIKPSSLNTKGMLDKKYRWAYYGVYPNYWVQPVYTGNQIDTKSQLLYIQNKSAANTCNLKVNNVGNYEANYKSCGPTLCTPGRSTAKFKYNDMARNGPYTKNLYNPVSYSQYNLYLTRGCNNPIGPQKPFPYAVQTGTSTAAAGTSIRNFASGCNTSNIYLTPPEWYIKSGPQKPKQIKNISQTNPFIC